MSQARTLLRSRFLLVVAAGAVLAIRPMERPQVLGHEHLPAFSRAHPRRRPRPTIPARAIAIESARRVASPASPLARPPLAPDRCPHGPVASRPDPGRIADASAPRLALHLRC